MIKKIKENRYEYCGDIYIASNNCHNDICDICELSSYIECKRDYRLMQRCSELIGNDSYFIKVIRQ